MLEPVLAMNRILFLSAQQVGQHFAVGAGDGDGVQAFTIKQDVQVVAVVVEEPDFAYVDQVRTVAAGNGTLQVILNVLGGGAYHCVLQFTVLFVEDFHVVVFRYGVQNVAYTQ